MKMMRTCLVATLVFVLNTGLCLAEDKVVEANGFSAISEADAIRQAQRAAVEQAVGIFVKTQTEIESFNLKKDVIFTRTEGYITRFDILSKSVQPGDFKVTIRATVSLDKIKDDLIAMKILLESLERPKVVILVSETYQNMESMGLAIAATEIASLMGAKGFDLVDKAQLDRINQSDQARQALAGNKAAAKSLGLATGAQYVIIGKAVAQDVGEAMANTGIRSVQSSLQVQVIATQSGAVLGSVVKNSVAAHISSLTGATKALQQAARKVVDEYLVDNITNAFQDQLNNGMPVKLYVTGVSSFRHYKDVNNFMQGNSRVVSSKKEGWNKAGGLLILDMRFRGTSEELAELLDGQSVSGQTIEVTDFAPERVDANLK
jgi:hypothetical protein